jgi:hypothetical protein
MKPEKDTDRTFEWDLITVAIIVVVAFLFLAILLVAIGPLGHAR